MDKILMFIKDFVPQKVRTPLFWVLLFCIFLWGLLKFNTNSHQGFLFLTQSVKGTITVIKEHIFSLISITILVFSVWRLLVYSTKVFEEERQEEYPETRQWTTQKDSILLAEIIEKRVVDEKIYIKRYINIRNQSVSQDVNNIKGTFTIYDNGVIVDEFPIERALLRKNEGIIVQNKIFPLSDHDHRWDNFVLFIDRMDVGGNLFSDKRISARKNMYRIYDFLFKKNNFIPKTKYEYSYIKEIYQFHIRPRIRFWIKYRRHYGKTAVRQEIEQFVRWAVRMIGFVFVTVIASLIVLYIFYSLINFVVDIIAIWYRFIAELWRIYFV